MPVPRRIALAGLLVLAACRPHASRPGAGPAAADAPGPRRGVFERELILAGEIEAVRSLSIKSPQTQLFQLRIQHMAEEGEPVKAGDVILTFDSASLVARVDELKSGILDAETQIVTKQAEIASALKDLEIELSEKEHAEQDARLQASVDADVLPRKVWGERQLGRQKAEEELREMRKRSELTTRRGRAELDVLVIARDKLKQDLALVQQGLDLLTIRAPSDGVVVYERKMENMTRYQEGDSCWPGQGILQLPDMSEMRVAFAVHEVDAPQIRQGMPVRVVLDAFPGREIDGVIEHVPSMAVRKSEESKISVFRMHASLAESWPGEMKPGMSARGRAVVERIEDAPLLARSEVRFDGEAWWWPSGAPPEHALSLAPLARNARDYLLSEEDFSRLSAAAQARPSA
jgi:HlyD family secretion protein